MIERENFQNHYFHLSSSKIEPAEIIQPIGAAELMLTCQGEKSSNFTLERTGTVNIYISNGLRSAKRKTLVIH